MPEFPIKQFRLERGYSFAEPLRGPQISADNILVGSTTSGTEPEAFFLGKLAEYDNMKANIWLDIGGAHSVYVMGKRRSGKSFTLGVIAEGLVSSQWVKQANEKQAVLVFDTMNVFLTMNHSIGEVFGSKSKEYRELQRWGLATEQLPLKFLFPRGTQAPPEGDQIEFTIRPSDLRAEDWASLFDVDTYSDPIGQLIAELYEKVTVEGYRNASGEQVSPNPRYGFRDLLGCLDRSPELQRYEPKTIEAVRRRLRAMERLSIFSHTGLNIQQLFVPGRISIILLRDLDHSIRALVTGIVVKQIMQLRSLSDRFERMAEVYSAKAAANKEDSTATLEAQKTSEHYLLEAKQGLPRGWIIIDEAHNYIPNKGFIASREVLKKYVNEGRNLGLSIVVATQQPSGLDPAIQRNADILVVHSMSMGDDIQAAERMINTYVPDTVTVDNREKIESRVFEQTIRSLAAGYAIISNDRMNRLFPIKVRPRISFHGGLKY